MVSVAQDDSGSNKEDGSLTERKREVAKEENDCGGEREVIAGDGKGKREMCGG